MAGGESQDVGDRVGAAILSVESADCVVVAEGQGQLAVLVGESGVEGG